MNICIHVLLRIEQPLTASVYEGRSRRQEQAQIVQEYHLLQVTIIINIISIETSSE